MDMIVIDTLGKLATHGHGLSGYCQICRQHFSVSIAAMIMQRGADSPGTGMRPLVCSSCRGYRTEFRITAPSKGGG
jgi:hypothetical protein